MDDAEEEALLVEAVGRLFKDAAAGGARPNDSSLLWYFESSACISKILHERCVHESRRSKTRERVKGQAKKTDE